MNTNFTEGSATIYEFPTRVGSTVGARHHDETSAAGDFESPSFGSGWYHDAAVGAEEHTPNWRPASDAKASSKTPASGIRKRPQLYLV
jgi:Protein of unknown function (DUF2735)